MTKLKHYTILGIIFVAIFGTLSHFVYEWTDNNFIAGFFFPVNESTWEHLKLLFFPMLFYSFYMNHQLKNNYPCITSSLCLGILLGTLSIPVIFYTYTYLLGHHTLVLDIATFLLSVLIAFITVYKFTMSCKAENYKLLLNFFVLIMMFLFFVFTY